MIGPVEFDKALRELKDTIHTATASAVTKFKEHTGITPSDIEIEMIDAMLVDSYHTERVVGPVRISFRRL